MMGALSSFDARNFKPRCGRRKRHELGRRRRGQRIKIFLDRLLGWVYLEASSLTRGLPNLPKVELKQMFKLLLLAITTLFLSGCCQFLGICTSASIHTSIPSSQQFAEQRSLQDTLAVPHSSALAALTDAGQRSN
jgi:hypothetical protein